MQRFGFVNLPSALKLLVVFQVLKEIRISKSKLLEKGKMYIYIYTHTHIHIHI